MNVHGRCGSAVAFSPDGGVLTSASYDDSTLRAWDVATGRVLKTLCLSNRSENVVSQRHIAFSPDGKLIAFDGVNSGAGYKLIQIWDVETGSVLQIFERPLIRIGCLAFSPCGSFVASGSEDSKVRVWDVGTGNLLQTLVGHAQWIRSVQFSPDGTLIASTSEDESVRLWDNAIRHGGQATIRHTGTILHLVFSPNKTLVAAVLDDGTINLWDVFTGKITHIIKEHKNPIKSTVFSPNSSLLASASYDATVHVWDTATGKRLHIFANGFQVRGLDFSPDGNLIVSGSDNGDLHAWEVTSGKVQYTLKGHTAAVRSLTFSPNGKFIVSSAVGGARLHEVLIWQVETAQFIRVMRKFKYIPSSFTFSPDSSLVAVPAAESTWPPELFASGTGKLARRLEYPSLFVTMWNNCLISFSPDCHLVAAAANINRFRDVIYVWNVKTGKLRCTIEVLEILTAISFDITGTKMITNFCVFDVGTAGDIPASPSHIPLLEPPVTLLGPEDSIGFGLAEFWITLDGANILWLPMDYRCLGSTGAAILGDTVIIVCGSVGLLFLRFDRSQLQYHGTS
jgi:WD40 repeat protein